MKISIIKNTKSYLPEAYAYQQYLNNLGYRVYNNHINLVGKLNNIIPSINVIEFFFKDKYGNLYDFGNLNHSFTLKFNVEKILDKNANINTNTGLSYVNSSLNKVFIDNNTNRKYYADKNKF